MSKTARATSACLMAFFLAGCGKPSAPPPPKPPPPAATNPVPVPPRPEPVVTNAAPKPDPAEAAAREKAFSDKFAEILAMEQKGQFGEAMALARQVATDFRSHPRVSEVSAILLRLRQARKDSTDLLYAVKSLGSDSPTTARIAQRRLLEAGETGLIFLRMALEDKSAPAAAAGAAEALGEARDMASADTMIRRLSEEKRSALTVALMDALGRMAAKLDKAQLARCLQLVREDKDLQRRELAGVFEVLFREVCGGEADKFNDMLGTPGAHGDLRAFFERSVLSGNDEMVTFACAYGGEFLGYLNGLRADYYSDTGFLNLATSRFETVVTTAQGRSFPMPGGQQDNLSVRMTGHLWAERAGEYTFYVNADDVATVSVNGAAVVQGGPVHQPEGKVTLARGLHRFQVDYVQGGGDSWIRLDWAGPGFARNANLALRVRPMKSAVMALVGAPVKLAGDDPAVIRAARQAILARGDVGRTFLREAVRRGPLPVAERALALLVEGRDSRTVGVLLDRLAEEKPDAALVPVLARGLRDLAPAMEQTDACGLYAEFARDRSGMSPYAAGLCGLLDLRFGGVASNFTAFVGASNAYSELRTHVERALASESDEAVIRACEYGHPFVPLLSGLRGEYYEGEEWDRKVLDLQEWQLSYYENRFPTPGNRQDKISARWSGFVNADRPGDYQFVLQAESAGHLWVNGQYIVGSDHRSRANAGRITLGRGLHVFRAQFQEWAGEASMVLNWEPPGAQRQLLAGTSLRTHPWRAVLERVPEAVRSLTAADEAKLAWAKGHLRATDPLSRYFLRKALRDEAEPVAVAAAEMLVEFGDAGTPAVLVERLRRRPADALSRSVLLGLAGLPQHIGEADRRWLAGQMAGDAAAAMGPGAVALCKILESACGSDAASFNALFKDDQAHARLLAYVSRVREGRDPDALARLAEFGGSLVGYAEGIRARYYEGYNRDRLLFERVDGQMAVERDQFPHPAGRQDNVGVLWDGWFRVDAAGRYKVTAYTRQYADVFVDGRHLIAARGYDQVAEVDLGQGMHAVRVDYRQGPGERWSAIHWEGPGIQNQRLGPQWLRTSLWSNEVARCRAAAADLGHADAAKVGEARAALHARDAVSREFLRNTILHGPARAAVQAADLLAYRQDDAAGPFLLARIRSDPEFALTTAACDAALGNLRSVPADAWKGLLAGLKGEAQPRMGADAVLVCAALSVLCQGDPARFDALVAADGGHQQLKSYADAAVASQDRAVVVRALRYALPVADWPSGWVARFYEGWVPERLVAERLDGEIGLGQNQFPHPGGRQNNVSAVWQGVLNAPETGEYTFLMGARTHAALVLDGKTVLAPWEAEASWKGNLTRGPHTAFVRYHQRGGNVGVWLDWQGPGLQQRQRVAGTAVRSPMPEAAVDALAQAVVGLSAKDAKAVGESQGKLIAGWPTAVHLLRNVLRHQGDEAIAPAAGLLIARRDPLTADLLVARLQRDAKSPAAAAVWADLRRNAEYLSPASCAWLYGAAQKTLQADGRLQVETLCAILDRRCFGVAEDFNKVCGDPKAHETVAALVREALASADPAVVAWACTVGRSLAPAVEGLRAQYYEGRDFNSLVVDRVEPTVAAPQNRFPLGRQNEVSARWTGSIAVRQTGNYRFSVVAENVGRIFVDGQLVVQGEGIGQERSGTVRLDAGVHDLRAEAQNWGGGAGMLVFWEGPGVARQPISAALLRPAHDAKDIESLALSVRALQTGNDQQVAAARRAIDNFGAVGRFFLRKALRDEPPQVALAAVDVLAGMGDTNTVRGLVERVRADGPKAVERLVLVGLAGLADALPAEDVAWMVEQVARDDSAPMGAPAAALCALLDRRCGADRQKFAARVKSETAYDALHAHVGRALRSKDPAALLRACEFGSPFTGMASGLYGRYYEGLNFERLHAEKLDANMWIQQNRFPHAQNRQDNVSARWTGWLMVSAAGDYGFSVNTPQQADLWINGQPVASARGNEAQGAVKLGQGRHAVRVEYRQGGGGDRWLDVNWSGPGIQRQRLTSAWLRTPLWQSELARLAAALPALESDNADKAAEARGLFQADDAGSRDLLRNALHHGSEALAAQAVDLLVQRGDPATAAELTALLKASPDAAARWSVARGLSALAEHIPDADLPRLLERVRADAAGAMGAEAAALCAVLQVRCSGSGEAFGKLLGDAKAGDDLQAAVLKAAVSDDPQVLARAAEFGAPFVAPLPGWCGRYYEGGDLQKLVLERNDWAVEIQDRRFPHPQNRQSTVAAVWDGLLTVPKKGAYTFRLYGRDFARLLLNGKVVTEAGQAEAAGTEQLPAGVHRVRLEYRHGQGESGLWLDWEGPDLPRQRLSGAHVRSAPHRAAALALAGSVAELAGGDANRAAAARSRFLDGGAGGALFLKRAVRAGPENEAAAAARVLSVLRHRELGSLLMARVAKQPAPGLLRLAADAARQAGENFADADCAGLYRLATAGGTLADRDMIAALCGVLERRCRGDGQRFDAAVGDSNAWNRLSAAVGEALASTDLKAVAWACEYGGSLAPYQPGARGRYCEGTWFEKPVREVTDGAVGFPQDNFPHGRREGVSAQWSALLTVSKAGPHTFTTVADEGCRVWVDGALVVDAWNNAAGQERGGTVTLEPGPHTLDVAFWQAAGPHRMELHWQGPGFGRMPLSAAHLKTHPTAAEQAALVEQLRRLASANPAEVEAARVALRAWPATAAVYLRRAVRMESGKIVEESARLLLEFKDAAVPALLLERVKTAADPAVVGPAVTVLQGMPESVKAPDAAALLERLKQDKAFARRDLVDLFAAVFQKTCGSNADKFDKLTDSSGALGRIREYLWEASQSKDASVANWAKARAEQPPWKK